MYGRRRSRGGHRLNGIKKPDTRMDVARRIAGVMAQQRKGRQAPDFGLRSGRVDRRKVARASVNERVFTQRTAQSPTRLKVALVVDLSGSMYGYAANAAIQTAWDFATAANLMPNVDLEIWGHSTGYYERGEEQIATPSNDDGSTGVREGHYVVAYHLWEHGMTADQFHKGMRDIRMSGNEDGFSLNAIGTDVLKRAESGERVLILMLSDGAPVYSEGQAGYTHVRSVVQRLRRKGAAVVSISIDYSLRAETQGLMYGMQNVVKYTDNARELVTNLARVIGKNLN